MRIAILGVGRLGSFHAASLRALPDVTELRVYDADAARVCEATAFEHPDPVHLSYRELAAHRAELDCRRIVLTHLGDETLARLGDVGLECATDGAVLTV